MLRETNVEACARLHTGGDMARAVFGVLCTWVFLFFGVEILSSAEPGAEFYERPSLACRIILSGVLASTTLMLWMVVFEGGW